MPQDKEVKLSKRTDPYPEDRQSTPSTPLPMWEHIDESTWARLQAHCAVHGRTEINSRGSVFLYLGLETSRRARLVGWKFEQIRRANLNIIDEIGGKDAAKSNR